MTNPEIRAIELIPISEMEGIEFAIRYFDDDFKMYLSPSLLERIHKKEVENLTYVTLSWRKKQIGIDAVVQDIRARIETIPPGESVTMENLSKT